MGIVRLRLPTLVLLQTRWARCVKKQWANKNKKELVHARLMAKEPPPQAFLEKPPVHCEAQPKQPRSMQETQEEDEDAPRTKQEPAEY